MSLLANVVSTRRQALIVDDDLHYANTLAQELEQRGMAAHRAFSLEEATRCLERDDFGVVVMDNRFPGSALRGASYVRDNDWLLREHKIMIVTGTIGDIGDPQWLQDHDIPVLLKGEPSHLTEVADLAHEFATRELTVARHAVEDELQLLEPAAAINDEPRETSSISRIGEKLARASMFRLYEMLDRLPAPEQPQILLEGRKYSPNDLRRELNNQSDVAVKLVDMLLSDLFYREGDG